MLKQFIKKHPYKIIIGAPILFVVLVNSTGVLGLGNVFVLSAPDTLFPQVGDEMSVTVDVSTRAPVNAVGGTLLFPKDMLAVTGISRIQSSIDLWSEEPSYTNTDGTLHFSGGLVGPHTESPLSGNILTVTFIVLRSGKSDITMRDGELLAHDGVGTNLSSGSNTLTFYAHEANTASADINGDGELSIADANTLYVKTFREYDSRYDMNGDGKVSWADVRMLVGLF